MTIKQDTLVKAWSNDPSEYKIGVYDLYSLGYLAHKVDNGYYHNVVEIPPELVKALEELGND